MSLACGCPVIRETWASYNSVFFFERQTALHVLAGHLRHAAPDPEAVCQQCGILFRCTDSDGQRISHAVGAVACVCSVHAVCFYRYNLHNTLNIGAIVEHACRVLSETS